MGQGTLVHRGRAWESGQLPWGGSSGNELELPCDPAAPLLGMYPKDTKLGIRESHTLCLLWRRPHQQQVDAAWAPATSTRMETLRPCLVGPLLGHGRQCGTPGHCAVRVRKGDGGQHHDPTYTGTRTEQPTQGNGEGGENGGPQGGGGRWGAGGDGGQGRKPPGTHRRRMFRGPSLLGGTVYTTPSCPSASLGGQLCRPHPRKNRWRCDVTGHPPEDPVWVRTRLLDVGLPRLSVCVPQRHTLAPQPPRDGAHRREPGR